MHFDFTISDEFATNRLDRIIPIYWPVCTRSRAAELIYQGKIQVNERVKKPGYRVREGDRVLINADPVHPADTVAGESIDLEIVFEDNHLAVINKPWGMVVHPSPGHLSQTLVNAALHHFPGISQSSSDIYRPGIVHRLDKDTSGLIVLAKTAQAMTFLQNEFKQRRVDKHYLAIVHGFLEGEEGRISAPIGRHPVKRKIMAVSPENGKPALTLWRVKKRFESATLVDIHLKTGRTHQIRVHFYDMGYPLMGDKIYQYRRFRKQKSGPDRQMLHSTAIAFRHPYSGRKIAFTADPPVDFNQVLDQLTAEC